MAINLLVIGVGGFGRGVCNQLLLAPESSYGRTPRDFGITLLAIDGPLTDQNYAIDGAVNPITVDTSPSSSQFLQLDDSLAPSPVLKAIARGAPLPGQYKLQRQIEKFLDQDGADQCPDKPPSAGFGGCRPPGHVYVLMDGQRIQGRIRALVTQARNVMPGAPLVVAVCGSFCGGTGAGMLLDVAAATRDAVPSGGAGSDLLIGLIATPSDYPSRKAVSDRPDEATRLAEAKAWAGFRDLDRMMRASNSNPISVPVGAAQPVILQKFFDLCMPIEETISRGPHERIQDTIVPSAADLLFSLVEAENLPGTPGGIIEPALVNWSQTGMRVSHGGAPFTSPVTASVRFVRGECRDALVPLVVRELVHTILNGVDAGALPDLKDTLVDPAWHGQIMLQRSSYSSFTRPLQGIPDARSPGPLYRLKPRFVFFGKWDHSDAETELSPDFSAQVQWVDEVISLHRARIEAVLHQGFATVARSPYLTNVERYVREASDQLDVALVHIDAAVRANPMPTPPSIAPAEEFNQWHEQRLVHNLLASVRNLLVQIALRWQAVRNDITHDGSGWRRSLDHVRATAEAYAAPHMRVRAARAKWSHQVRLPEAGQERLLLKTPSMQKVVSDYLNALTWSIEETGGSARLKLKTISAGASRWLGEDFSVRVPDGFKGFDPNAEAAWLRDHVNLALEQVGLWEVVAECWGANWPQRLVDFLANEDEPLLRTPGAQPKAVPVELLIGAAVPPNLAARLQGTALPTPMATDGATSLRLFGFKPGFALEEMKWAQSAQVQYNMHQSVPRSEPVDIYRADFNTRQLRRHLLEVMRLTTTEVWAPEVVSLLDYLDPFRLFALAYALDALPKLDLNINGASHGFIGFAGCPPWDGPGLAGTSFLKALVPYNIPTGGNLVLGLAADPIWVLRNVQRHYAITPPPRADAHSAMVVRDLQARVFGRAWLADRANRDPDKGEPTQLTQWYSSRAVFSDGLVTAFGDTNEKIWGAALALDGTLLSRLSPQCRDPSLAARCQGSIVHKLTVPTPTIPAIHTAAGITSAPAAAYRHLADAMRAAIGMRALSFLRMGTEGAPSRPIKAADVDEGLARFKAIVKTLPRA